MLKGHGLPQSLLLANSLVLVHWKTMVKLQVLSTVHAQILNVNGAFLELCMSLQACSIFKTISLLSISVITKLKIHIS